MIDDTDYLDTLADKVAIASKRLLPLVFVASVAALVYYLFRGYLADFHSDSAVKNLLAQEVIREGTYFPSDWNYVNGDLWVLFGQVPIIPLLPFFKNGYALHAVSGLVSSAVVLLSLWLVSAMAIRGFWIRFAIVTVFAGGVSAMMAENLFGQISYGNVLFIAALTLYFGWRWLEAISVKEGIAWGMSFGILVLLAFWGNPQRAAAYDAAPMLAAIAAWAYARGPLATWRPGLRRWAPSRSAWRAIGLLAILVTSAGTGALFHVISIASVNNIDGAGAARWLDFSGMERNLWFSLQGALGIFGGLPPADGRVISLAGIYFALRFVSILILLLLMPIAIVRLLGDSRPSAKMFGAFVGTGLAVFVFLQVTTTTPDMSDPITSARYMLPSLAMGVIAVAALAEAKGFRSMSGAAGWLLIVVLLSSLISPLNPFSRIYRDYQKSPAQRLAAELERQGLEYGYATYWNAGSVTVLSGGDTHVRQINMVDGLPMPYRHLSSNHWYRPEAWQGRTFLALRDGEREGLDQGRFFSLVGRAEREFRFEDMTIWVFPGNIAAGLPDWNRAQSVHADLRVTISPASSHAIGSPLEENGRWVLSARGGESGFLHFGPYMNLPAGRYEIGFDMRAESASKPGYVDVVSEMGKRELARANIPPLQDGVLKVAFELGPGGAGGVEFRVHSSGTGALQLRGITIQHESGPAG